MIRRASQRRGGIWILGSVVAALAVVGVLVGLSISGRSSGGGDVPAAAREARALLDGVPQSGTSLGRSSAPIIVTEYADLQCPACRAAAIGLVPHVVDRWVRPGTVRLVIRPLVFIGPDSGRGALATEAAGRQDRAWTFADTLYRVQGGENSGWLDEAVVTKAARAVGLDGPAFDRARAAATARGTVRATARAFASLGANATPTFVFAGPRGRQGISGVPTEAGFDSFVMQVRGRP